MTEVTRYFIGRYTRVTDGRYVQDLYRPLTSDNIRKHDLVEIMALVEDECEEISADHSSPACKFIDENVQQVRRGEEDG